MSKLYKNNLFQVDLGMMRVQGSFAVPEDYSQNRLFEFQLNDKKEWSVTFNPTAQGVGMLRSGVNNELGIYFGGVFQKFETTQESLLRAQVSGSFSNKGYINPDTIQTGGPYLVSQLTSAPIVPESLDSLEFRNATAKPTTEESGLGSVNT